MYNVIVGRRSRGSVSRVWDCDRCTRSRTGLGTGRSNVPFDGSHVSLMRLGIGIPATDAPQGTVLTCRFCATTFLMPALTNIACL
jgi:hypothetical protein